MKDSTITLPWGANRRAVPTDPELLARLTALSTDHGELVPLETYRHDPLVAVGAEVVVHVASSAPADAQLRREAATRVWARAAGVAVPDGDLVEGPDGQGCSLVSVRAPSDPGTGPGYALAAAHAALAVQTAAGAPPAGSRTWRAPRRTRPLRAVRGALSPLRLREARALRDAVARLPADGWAHGDFRTYNVLYDSRTQLVQVVDWEYAGRAWRGSDLLALWACVEDPDVAGVLLDAVLTQHGPARAPEVGLVLLWSCVRMLAEQTTGTPLRSRDRDRVARVDARVSRARVLAAELGTVLP